MEDKITTIEQYQESLKEKKEIRDKMFDLRLEIVRNKKNPEKLQVLKDKNSLLKSKLVKLLLKITDYELENNIETKKEGKKK